jgi:hypothetical protein
MARTPQVVLDAIFRKPITIAGLKLQPFTMAHFLFLERLRHPLAADTIGELKGAEILEALVLLSLPGELVLALTEEELKARVAAAAAKIAVGDILGIANKLITHVRSYFAVQPEKFAALNDGDGADRPFARARRKRASDPAGQSACSRKDAKRTRRECERSSRRRSIG